MPDVVHALCFPWAGREAVCQLEGHQEGAEAVALVPATAPGKGESSFLPPREGLQDVSLCTGSSAAWESIQL